MNSGTFRHDVFVPSVWRGFYEETHVPAAILAGDILCVTGHTGEDRDGAFSTDVETQIRGTFRNIAFTLAEAGADWSNVVQLTSYHIGLQRQIPVMMAVAREFLHDSAGLDGIRRDGTL